VTLRCTWFAYGYIGRERLANPRLATGLFIALTIIGVVMPISGNWLLIPPAAGMVFRRRKRE